ncbi:hypothetical protein QYE76_025757 [Lolium multiflorum]|uniref:Retrotransposon gag domain-containing protein n=1 Tax=Lolium multiflorum TaxID=4521 RepID=A0AAD8VWY4_LOLMU|nr:hypothetical protein QYE76_025757 [Lolium multiflorum]
MSSSSSSTVLVVALGSPPSQKLTRGNFLFWKTLVLPTLRGAQVLPLLEGTDVAPPEFIEEEDADKKKIKTAILAYAAWIARDQAVMSYLLNSLSPDILAHTVGLESSAQVWLKINTMFSTAYRSKVNNLRDALNSTKKLELSATAYFAKMKGFCSELTAMGKPVDDDELVGYICPLMTSAKHISKPQVILTPFTPTSFSVDVILVGVPTVAVLMMIEAAAVMMVVAEMILDVAMISVVMIGAVKTGAAMMTVAVMNLLVAVMTLHVVGMMILLDAVMTSVMVVLLPVAVMMATALTIAVVAVCPLFLWIPRARYARSMATLLLIDGGAMKAIVMILMTMIVKPKMLIWRPMALIQTAPCRACASIAPSARHVAAFYWPVGRAEPAPTALRHVAAPDWTPARTALGPACLFAGRVRACGCTSDIRVGCSPGADTAWSRIFCASGCYCSWCANTLTERLDKALYGLKQAPRA